MTAETFTRRKPVRSDPVDPSQVATRIRSAFVMSRGLAWSLFVASFLVLIIGLVWTMVAPSGIYVAFSATASLIVTLPAVMLNDYDLISPWSLIILSIYIATVKSFFIAVGRNGSRTIDELFLLGHQPDYFIRPGALYVVAIALMTLGYMAARHRPPAKTIMTKVARLRFGPNFEIVITIFAIVGFAAFVIYALNTDGLRPSQLSAKRTTISGIDLETGYQSFGQFRVLNYFSSIAFWAALAKYAHARVRHHPLTLRGVFLSLLFVNACLLPLYTSARRDIFYLVIVGVVIELCLTTAKSVRRVIVVAITFVLVVAPILTTLRSQQAEDSARQGGFEALLETFIYNRTFTDMNTSALIINSVPDDLPYANGATIASYLVAPVPRSLWPGKPVISPGTEVGLVIFDNDRSGVPPGLIAESYWNFGVVGLLLIPLLFGWVLRFSHDRTAPYVRESPAVTLVYAVCVFRLGIDAITNSIGFTIFSFLEFFVLLFVVLLATCRTPNKMTGEAQGRRLTARPGKATSRV